MNLVFAYFYNFIIYVILIILILILFIILVRHIKRNIKLKTKNLKYIEENQRYIFVVSQITQFNSNFVINEKEKNFIKELINNIETSGLDYRQIKLHRLASGSLQFTYEKGWYIGNINLQSKYSSMQILKGLYINKNYTFETITECVNLIPKWINYIKYCKRTDSIEH